MRPATSKTILCLVMAQYLTFAGCTPASVKNSAGSGIAHSQSSATTAQSHAGRPETAQPQPFPANLPDDQKALRLTDYLHQHRLPLVQAVVRRAGGKRHLVLYGFVATPFGKKDAEDKARALLSKDDLVVTNLIKVRPELARPAQEATNTEHPSGQGEAQAVATSGSNSSTSAEVEAYERNLRSAEQYRQQAERSGWLDRLLLALLVAAMIL